MIIFNKDLAGWLTLSKGGESHSCHLQTGEEEESADVQHKSLEPSEREGTVVWLLSEANQEASQKVAGMCGHWKAQGAEVCCQQTVA